MKWTGCQAARRCTCVSSRSNERWRLLATYRADDEDPKEAFVSHQAGLDGSGSSSYIDSVILRQKDANSGWTSAADGTLEERRYYCQNWRNDTSVVLTSAAVMVEWGKFSAYGVPFGLPAADLDSDGNTVAGDDTTIGTWSSAYDVRADLDLDGDIDGDDATLASGYVGWSLGWSVLSHEDVANRLGYAGYHKDINLDISHVRNRVLDPHLGRWTRRDPLGYVDGMGLYEYVAAMAVVATDPSGSRLVTKRWALKKLGVPFAFVTLTYDVQRCSVELVGCDLTGWTMFIVGTYEVFCYPSEYIRDCRPHSACEECNMRTLDVLVRVRKTVGFKGIGFGWFSEEWLDNERPESCCCDGTNTPCGNELIPFLVWPM